MRESRCCTPPSLDARTSRRTPLVFLVLLTLLGGLALEVRLARANNSALAAKDRNFRGRSPQVGPQEKHLLGGDGSGQSAAGSIVRPIAQVPSSSHAVGLLTYAPTQANLPVPLKYTPAYVHGQQAIGIHARHVRKVLQALDMPLWTTVEALKLAVDGSHRSTELKNGPRLKRSLRQAGRLISTLARQLSTQLSVLRLFERAARTFGQEFADLQTRNDDVHDANNILQALVGYADLAALNIGTASTLPNWEAVGPDIRRLTDSFFKLNRKLKGWSGGTQTNLAEVVETVTWEHESKAKKRTVGVHVDFGALAMSPALVAGDSVRWADGIRNLFQNAFRHAGSTLSEIVIRLSEGQGGQLRLEFQDDGQGIPRENRDKIWDRLFTTHEQGNGTGLSSLAGFIASIGGKYRTEDANWTEGAKKGGARFVFDVPRVPTTGKDAAK